jgi:hypothetical protein
LGSGGGGGSTGFDTDDPIYNQTTFILELNGPIRISLSSFVKRLYKYNDNIAKINPMTGDTRILNHPSPSSSSFCLSIKYFVTNVIIINITRDITRDMFEVSILFNTVFIYELY